MLTVVRVNQRVQGWLQVEILGSILWGGARGSREELWCLVFGNMKTSVAKTDEIASASVATVLAVGFFSGKRELD